MDNIVFWRLCNDFFVYDFHNIFIYFLSIIYVLLMTKEERKNMNFIAKEGEM
jgi:hypothetical protein